MLKADNGIYEGFKIICQKCGAECRLLDTHIFKNSKELEEIRTSIRCIKCGNKSPEYKLL